MHHFPQKNLVIPASAHTVHKKILLLLQHLLSLNVSSPLDEEFRRKYDEFLFLFHQFQNKVLTEYAKKVTCKRGCYYCCYHWVEDVYSFEGELIAEYIRAHFPEKIEVIIMKCNEDEEHLTHLHTVMEQKLIEHQSDKEVPDIDETDLLLASFYHLALPCVFLSDDKTCSIYAVRPLTCRMYMSFSDPELCKPEHINASEIPTYLLDLEEDANKLLDALHEKFDHYNKSSLRSLICDYLR